MSPGAGKVRGSVEQPATSFTEGGWDFPTQISRVASTSLVELHLCARPSVDSEDLREQARSMYEALFSALEAQGARAADVATERVFLSDIRSQVRPLEEVRREYHRDGPDGLFRPATTFIQQAPVRGDRLCEIQAYAVLPRSPGSIPCRRLDELPPGATGLVMEIDGLRHLFLANVTGSDEDGRRGLNRETDSMFRRAESCLVREGLTFRDVVRTWICLAQIDRDYSAFNLARRGFFLSRSITPPPASTGILGQPHPPGKGCCLDLRAVDRRNGPRVRPIHAKTLNEAPDYGSDFSRGMRVDYRDRSVVYISGTASIDTEGRVVHLGEIEPQVDRMLVNVEELFAGQGATYENVVSAITYLKRPEYAEAFRRVAARRGMPERIPNTLCVADICRPEWLCEIELVAVLS
jgi:enamine deaminase RidA (YjgF/YER057c/UK114 family)